MDAKKEAEVIEQCWQQAECAVAWPSGDGDPNYHYRDGSFFKRFMESYRASASWQRRVEPPLPPYVTVADCGAWTP